MTVTGRLELLAFDAPDIERLASFYVELTGWQIVRKVSDWIALQAADGQEIAFEFAPDHVPPQWSGQEHPQQFHLDLTIDDTAAAAERGGGSSVMFQQVEGHNPPRWPDPSYPQQAHLDILVDDLDAGEARALELGASRLPGGGERFRVYADPAGHPFCLSL
jgi:predicted enzyme related to lactoylglutathione lyase